MKNKKHMCVVFSIIERVYWYSRVTLLGMSIDGSSYVSSPRPFILRIHFVVYFERETSDGSSGSLSIPSLRSLLTWLPFIFDLSGSSLILVFYASSSSSFSLLIHCFHFTSHFFSHKDSFSGLILSLHHHCTFHYHFGSPHWHHVRNRHPQVHGS